MAWDFNFPDGDAAQTLQQIRTVLSSDILVGHILDTPLQGSTQIGALSSDTQASDADTFIFTDDALTPITISTPQTQVPITPAEAQPALHAPVEPVYEIPVTPAGSAWNIETISSGRKILSPENDLLQARIGNRVDGVELVGTRGSDTLTGTDEDDVFIGALGDDIMSGGAGADVFVFSQSSTGHDRITDFTLGEDHLYFAAETIFELDEITVSQQGDDTVLSWHRGHSELVLQDFDASDLDADSFILAAM